MNIFEQAARNKIRFPTAKGGITTEQLFDLPLIGNEGVNLDAVAIKVNESLESVTTKSFVDISPDPRKSEYQLQMDIVKHIIQVKQLDIEAAKSRAEKSDRRRKLVAALSAKQDEKFGEMSEKAILKELEQIDSSD